MRRAPYVRRRRRLGWAMRLAVVLLWPFLRIMVRWQIDGDERLTAAAGGIVVAPNHLSWFDPLVVSYVLWGADRPPRFLAKEGLFHVTVLGSILRNAQQIPVYRDSADAANAIRDGVQALGEGECLAVYPEGTITRDPDLWPMGAKSGAVRLAMLSGAPLIPMAQWGAQEIMPPYRKAFRILPRKTVQVRIGEPIDLSDLTSMDARTLAIGGERLMSAITELEAQIRGEVPPDTRIVFRRGDDDGQEGTP